MLVAARDAGVRRFVYAASSSTYGDHPGLPKVEDAIGRPLSPYAVTKYVDELYADVFGRCYGMATVGLRYFNVFGPRQDPEGAYAAVIPRWVRAMLRGGPVAIHGDGETTRDFCYVDNVVQANLLAATAAGATGRVYNVAVGAETSLNELHAVLASCLRERHPGLRIAPRGARRFPSRRRPPFAGRHRARADAPGLRADARPPFRAPRVAALVRGALRRSRPGRPGEPACARRGVRRSRG